MGHVRPVLTETGDLSPVEETIAHLFSNGTGAHRQRTVLRRAGNLQHVILDAAERTTGTAASL
jgi:carboxylate-amine ligase